MVLILMSAALAHAEDQRNASLPEYNLSVSFDIAASKIIGKAKIHARAGKELIIHPGELKILKAVADGNTIELAGKDSQKILLKTDGIVQIDYEAVFSQSKDDIIDNRGIALRGTWYPIVEGMCIYQLKAILPDGYTAISETGNITMDKRGNSIHYDFAFPYPLNDEDGISLIASKNFVVTVDAYKGIEISTYLFPGEASFAKTFIEQTKRYLEMYEKLLGKYPYKTLFIVEHFEPAGYSMPGYIFLGKENFKMPVEKTPLGHEIVHQWFGNYVYTDYKKGNWNEGLTIYFADYAYDEQQGKGWKCRRRILSGFKSHVKDTREFPLRGFSERYDSASRSIGYGKAAMVVHMLRKTVGDDLFYAAIRDFITENKFRVASWEDIKRTFEKKTDKDLSGFFDQWINSKGTPRLSIEDVRATGSQRKFSVGFDLVQKETNFTLPVPVSFYSKGKKTTRIFMLGKERERFNVILPEMPDEIVLDEDYDLFRVMTPEEDPPTLERLASDEKRLIVLPPERKGMYREVIDAFNRKGEGIKQSYMKSGDSPLKDHSGNEQRKHRQLLMRNSQHKNQFISREMSEIGDDEMRSSSLVVLGKDNPLIEKLFGRMEYTKGNDSLLRIDIKMNPLNPEKVVAIINIAERQKAATILEEIFDYPFYSDYSLKDGRILKELKETPRGIRIKPDYGKLN